MKNLLFSVVAVAVLAVSCAKDHTCVCTTTISGTSVASSFIIPESTKDDAKTICKQGESYSKGDTQITECELE